MSCPICENPFCEIVRKDGSSTTFDCAACGTYAVAQTALTTHLNGTRQELTPIKRAAISHLLREATDAGLKPLLTTYELDNWFANATLPSAAQQATNVIRLVGDHVSKTGMPLDTLPPDVCAIVGSPNQGFISRIMEQLIERKLLDGRKAHFGDWLEIDLTLDGWERYDAEKRGEVAGSYGFIALKFNDAVLDPFLQDVIKPSPTSVSRWRTCAMQLRPA